MIKCDVAIVGGGAAGLAAAVTLLRNNQNCNVVLIDAGERLGKKLAATGNGQGNVTNADMSASHYFGGNLRLVERLCCTPDRLSAEQELFHCVITQDEIGRCYPGGRQASALTDSLLFELNRGGARILTATKVVELQRGFTLTLSDGQSVDARFVLFCVGGKAQKQFKTDGSSYALVERLGHTVTPLYPSLVQLKTDTQYLRGLKGIRADCRVTALQNGKPLAGKCGDVIFTDYGVSGNAIFAISPYVVDKRNVTLNLEFLPQTDVSVVERDILRKQELGYPDSELLGGTLHNQLGRAIVRRCASCDAQKLAYLVKHFTLQVTGNLGFDYAQVTKGGVSMDGVTDDLESKLVKNLYFAGEVLDVDGECGGYNLHWAFCSGIFAARNILDKL